MILPDVRVGSADEPRKATAQAAGLAAYLISLPSVGVPIDVSTAQKVKDTMISLALPRESWQGQFRFIFNGVRPWEAGNSGPVSHNVKAHNATGQ